MAVKQVHLTTQAHTLIEEHCATLNKRPDIAIDATCGNGFDTVFLAELVSDKVFGFDIQTIAITKTREQLESKGLLHKVTLIKDGHQHMSKHVESKADIIMFNLGYLPQADKAVTTLTQTSLSALEQALDLLSDSGILSILCYPGHAEGKTETHAVKAWLEHLPDHYKLDTHLANHPNDRSPVLFLVSVRA